MSTIVTYYFSDSDCQKQACAKLEKEFGWTSADRWHHNGTCYIYISDGIQDLEKAKNICEDCKGVKS